MSVEAARSSRGLGELIFTKWQAHRMKSTRTIATVTLCGWVGLGAFASESQYRSDEAINHVGEDATVCGVVASAKYATSTRRQPTFLNLDKPYPNQVFTAVIWGSDRPQFKYEPESLQGAAVCVSGEIRTRKQPAHWIRGARISFLM